MFGEIYQPTMEYSLKFICFIYLCTYFTFICLFQILIATNFISSVIQSFFLRLYFCSLLTFSSCILNLSSLLAILIGCEPFVCVVPMSLFSINVAIFWSLWHGVLFWPHLRQSPTWSSTLHSCLIPNCW